MHFFENYLISLPADLRRALCHFRCINHKFPIEKGRFWGVDRDERLCDLCNKNALGMNFITFLNVSFSKMNEKKFLPRQFIVHPNSVKLHDLLNTDDNRVLFQFAKFCKILLSVIK